MSTRQKASRSVLAGTTVADVMSRGVVSCPLELPLRDVARLMARNRVHSVVGFGDATDDDTRLWGIVSDLDLVAAAASEDLEGRTAGGTAETEIVTVGPKDSLLGAAELMSEHRLTHLLVRDERSDRPVGVVSTFDVIAAVAGTAEPPRAHGAMRVEQLMTRRVVGVSPETPLKDVAALLVEHRISGVPVVHGEEVVGVVSEEDILSKERGPGADQARARFNWILGGGGEDAPRTKLAARTAGEIMTAPAITIEPWRTASAAASLMAERWVKRLPVVENGKLVGILSRGDLVRAFARPDAEIEEDIRRDVLLQSLSVGPGDVEVAVRGGEVTLRGEVETDLLVELLPEEVQRVPGVVTVHSELRAAAAEKPALATDWRWTR